MEIRDRYGAPAPYRSRPDCGDSSLSKDVKAWGGTIENSLKPHVLRPRVSERAKKNITQAQLAELVKVSRQTINAIELGKYNLSTILALKIAHVFNQSIHNIFELEESDWES